MSIFNLPSVITAGSSGALGANISNQQAILIEKTLAGIARVASKSGNWRVFWAGDSTVFGDYSNNGTNVGDLAKNSITAAFAQQLAGNYPVSENSVAGGGLPTDGNRLTNDSRFAFTGGWTVAPTGGAAGGGLISTSLAGKLSFSPRTYCDSFAYWYARTPSSGTFSIDINGGTATNINSSGANGLIKTTLSGALINNTFNINYVSGGPVFYGAIEAWDSTKSQIIVMNAGAPGSVTGDWTQNGAPYNARQAVPILASDTIFLQLGINDWLQNVPLTVFYNNLQTLVSSWKPFADVIMVTPAPSSISNIPLATQQAYIQQIYNLAAANGLLVIDTFGKIQSYEIGNPLGLYGQLVHPNQNGYALQAATVIEGVPIPNGPGNTGTVNLRGQISLAAGTVTINNPNISVNSSAQVQVISPVGTLGVGYKAVCTSGVLTITAYGSGGTIAPLDTSTIQYEIIF